MGDTNKKLEKALRLMSQKGLNGLIVYSNGVCNILRPSYLLYFSGFKPMGPRNAAILSRSGEAALLVNPPWDSLRASEKSWIKNVQGARDFVGDMIGILRKLKISGPVGVAGSREMTHEVYTGLQKVVSVKTADDIIEEMAREKTEEEIEIMRKTARIADVGTEAFVNSVRVGIREYELVAEMEYALRSAGGDDIFILLSSGSHNNEMHEPTDRRLRKGDIVIGEITPVYKGQFIQLCPTVVLGKPSPVLVEKYQILVRALHESMNQMKAGVPASIITIAMNRIFSEAGYAKYCNPPYMRSRGHGFGVGSIAPGAEITDKMQVNLEKNQAVAVHPNQYIPETGYLACGETVLVTDTGVERLTKTEMKLYVKEG
ncbi:MAG: M24 family metallopeptidase [Thermodesulfobacteriota bacterium]